MAKRSVLLVSYSFPPLGGSGVQRALKLARYWPDCGWRPHVVCAGHSRSTTLDESLVQEIPDDCTVNRVLGVEPSALGVRVATAFPTRTREYFDMRLTWRLQHLARSLRVPEDELFWAPSAAMRAATIVRDEQAQAVVTTSPPLASHLVGRWLKSRHGIPWIADLRDPILDNFSTQAQGRIYERYTRWIERTVVERADAVVVTCPELAQRLQARYPAAPADKFHFIPNGYDELDRPPRPRETNDAFVFVHVGAFYRKQSIRPLVEALRALFARRPDWVGRVQFHVVGTIAASQRMHLREQDGRFLREIGYVDHSAATQAMAGADCLVLTVPPEDGGRYCIPAKTFEYLAFGRRIVAFAHPNTYLARLLARTPGCTLLKACDAQSWGRAFEEIHDASVRDGSPSLDRGATIQMFRRDKLAAAFAEILNKCVCPSAETTAHVPQPVEAKAAI